MYIKHKFTARVAQHNKCKAVAMDYKCNAELTSVYVKHKLVKMNTFFPRQSACIMKQIH